jgi:hypothetical protein
MTEILTTALTLLVLLAGLAALVAHAHHDRYPAPGTGRRHPW